MRRRRAAVRVAVGAVAAAGCVAVAHGAIPLTTPKFGAARLVTSVQTSAFLQEIGAADVTGDGNTDIVVTRIVIDHPQLEPITILVGDGPR
jgi:hypothetical protein